MADKLETKLRKIEDALGGTEPTPDTEDKLGWHLDYIEELAQEGGGGTTVVANPEMSGDEDDLVGLQVGETKYKVNSGSYSNYNSIMCSISIDNQGQHCFFDNDVNNTPGSSRWNQLFESLSTNGASLGTVDFTSDINFENYCCLFGAHEWANDLGEIIQTINCDDVYLSGYVSINYNVARDEFYVDVSSIFIGGERRKLILNESGDIVYDDVIFPSYILYCPFDFSQNDNWYDNSTNLEDWESNRKHSRLLDMDRFLDESLSMSLIIVSDDDDEKVIKSYFARYYAVEVVEDNLWEIHILTSDGEYIINIDVSEEE